jgi:hypothetical protein
MSSTKFVVRLMSSTNKYNKKFSKVLDKFVNKKPSIIEKDSKVLFLQEELVSDDYLRDVECCGNMENICPSCPYNKYD